MSEVMEPIPEDHPLWQAWKRYRSTEDYENTRRWALHSDHVDGSLWAAFMAGYNVNADQLQLLRDGIRDQIGVLERTAARYREYRLNGQAQLWDMAANNLRRLLGEDGQ